MCAMLCYVTCALHLMSEYLLVGYDCS